MVPGQYVTPSIRLVRLLGRGGMGAVWIAEHEKLHTEVVVKFILGSEAALPEARQRFEREAALAALAKSPHVVQVFDHGITADGVPYIAMERLHGEDLASRLEREHRIDPAVFAEWLRQICAGIGRAHSRGIIHRDLKPENLFLCNEDGEVLVKLLDFGIAKAKTFGEAFGATMTGAMLGTVHFMSPEQTMGDAEVDARSDLWALGVLTYYSLTGVLPFQGDALGAVVVKITTSEPRPPSSLVPTLPRAIDGWMKRALAKNPSERFADARTMAAAFHEAVFGFAVPRPYDYGDTDNSNPVHLVPRNATTLTPATGHGPSPMSELAGKSRVPILLGLGALTVASALAFLAPDIYGRLTGKERTGVTELEPLAASPGVAQPDSDYEATPEVADRAATPERAPSVPLESIEALSEDAPAGTPAASKARPRPRTGTPAAPRSGERATPERAQPERRGASPPKSGLTMKLE